MKVLIASQAIDGHFNPLTGIAKQLQGSGHDVRWYTGSHFGPRLAELGIAHYPFVRAVEHTPDNLNELYPGRERLRGPQVVALDSEKVFASNVGHFFDDIREIRESFGFDVIVADGAIFVQRLVRDLLQVPFVSVGPIPNMQRDPLTPPLFFGLLPATNWRGRLRDRALQMVSERVVMARAHRLYVSILAGYGVTMPTGVFFTDEPYRASSAMVQPGTASFDYPRANPNPLVHCVGPLLPYRTEEQQPLDLGDKQGRYGRTVLVTQGTVDNKDLSKLIVPTLEALKDTDTLILVSTSHSGTVDLRRRYPQDNIVIEDYIDFASALQNTDVFVTNGGLGGVLLSLTGGVPMVCAGLREGKNDINALVEYHQVGINLRTEKPRAADIRSAVERITTEPAWKTTVARFQQEMLALDPLTTVEDTVDSIVAARSTATFNQADGRT